MKIKLDQEKCIGCGSCAAVCPKLFEMAEGGKSHLLGSKKESQAIELIDVSESGCAKDAADVCPVQAITVE